MSYSASDSAVLKVNRFYIHGWQAEINGTSAEIKFEDKMGVILIDVPKCSNCKLKIWLPMLWCEKIGYIISAVSLFIFALLAYYFNRAKKPE